MFYSVPQSLVQLPVPTERSGTLSTRWEHHWNTVISLASHYFPVPLSAPLRATVVGTALELFPVPNAFDYDGNIPVPLRADAGENHTFKKKPLLRVSKIH